MNISKSLFKNLSRCKDFTSIYDMYIFRNAHHIKEIKGEDISKFKESVEQLEEGLFLEEHEKAMEMFCSMFDEETGEDLTITTNAQMEAYAEYFKELEIFAAEYIKKKFKGDIIYSENTKEQKKYEFSINGITYYCYLDIYLETETSIKIFEVKATTTTQFYKLGSEIKKGLPVNALGYDRYDSIFVKDAEGILRLKELYDSSKLNDKKYVNNRNKMFERFANNSSGKYIYDISVERYIIEKSLGDSKPNIEYYLVVFNGDYVYDGKTIDGKRVYETNENGNDLVSIIDVTKITEEYQEKIDLERRQIEEHLQDRIIEGACTSKHCELKKSTECKFKKVCFKNALCDGSILEYIRKKDAFGGKNTDYDKFDVYELINQGCYKIDSIPRDYLGKKANQIQYDCYTTNDTFIDEQKIILAIKSLQYPLYHLDFESYACPFPRYYGEKPYTQSVFQYSLHVEKTPFDCDKEKDHYEFLAKDHGDCRRELCEKMIKDIDLSNGGTVIVYNEGFEKTRLKELAIIYPDLSEGLLNIRDHVFDLLYVLKGNSKMFLNLLPADTINLEERAKEINYYHNNLHGSFSIKKVLPIFSDLSYANLDVHNGTEAVYVYGLLPTLTDKEYDDKYLALRKYCQQDTWAMVEVLWGLKNKFNV